ncbi:MAG: ERAP1-like C-terminal domain-containing protein, partial [Frankia sp.]
LMRAAPAGSDFQLVYALRYAQTTDPGQLAGVRAIFEGAQVVPGLTLDTELRWSLLTQLVARGVYGDAEIDAELARDATAAGEKRAATARSARPTAEAKAAAWAAVMETDTLSNHVLAATMAGFWVPDQADLTRPYVQRYFDEIGQIWQTRTIDTAQTITTMLFPSSVIEPATVEAVDTYLATKEPQPALRRALQENRDDLLRSLAARERDRAAAAD